MPPKKRTTTTVESEAVSVTTPQNPLGWPEGSVRAVLALIIIVLSFVGGFVLLLKEIVGFDQFLSMQSLAGVVMGYYFGARNS